MKAIEYRLPKEFDKSFIVFNEKGTHFPFVPGTTILNLNLY